MTTSLVAQELEETKLIVRDATAKISSIPVDETTHSDVKDTIALIKAASTSVCFILDAPNLAEEITLPNIVTLKETSAAIVNQTNKLTSSLPEPEPA